jgi:hypothetical protein
LRLRQGDLYRVEATRLILLSLYHISSPSGAGSAGGGGATAEVLLRLVEVLVRPTAATTGWTGCREMLLGMAVPTQGPGVALTSGRGLFSHLRDEASLLVCLTREFERHLASPEPSGRADLICHLCIMALGLSESPTVRPSGMCLRC